MALIGIMGGTFDPIHRGHVKLALAAYEQYHLDKVIFIPSGDPPHKKGQKITDGAHRFHMVCLAIKDYPYFTASDMEIRRKGYTYTYETLKELHGQNTQDEIYFIIGADSLYHFESWYHPEEIVKLCVLLVADRDDIPQEEFLNRISYLNEKYDADIRPLKTPMMDISSTQIRDAMSDNVLDDNDEINRNLVDENVLTYIRQNKLYCWNEIL